LRSPQRGDANRGARHVSDKKFVRVCVRGYDKRFASVAGCRSSHVHTGTRRVTSSYERAGLLI
jgi:hypothetical protein